MTKDRQEPADIRYDEVGYWSEVKLDIVRKYAQAYSKLLSAQERPKLYHVYVDGFAGSGVHLSKTSGQFVLGSPLNALEIRPPFREFHLVDLEGDKVEQLRTLIGERPDVHVHHGDCNQVLLEEVFPKIRYEDYRRGLCLLDPYRLNINWEVIETAGTKSSIDLFLNFQIVDANRNVLWKDPSKVSPEQAARLTRFWGDDSWREAAYRREKGLSDEEQVKRSNDQVAEAFRKRLCEVANFEHVPAPMPLRNSKGAVVYYLYFASQKAVAKDIVTDIFNTYRERGA